MFSGGRKKGALGTNELIREEPKKKNLSFKDPLNASNFKFSSL